MMNYYFYELPKNQNRRKDREHGSTDIGANWIINDYTNFGLANRIFAENKGIASALNKQDSYFSLLTYPHARLRERPRKEFELILEF